jgi:hypothetical protein
MVMGINIVVVAAVSAEMILDWITFGLLDVRVRIPVQLANNRAGSTLDRTAIALKKSMFVWRNPSDTRIKSRIGCARRLVLVENELPLTSSYSTTIRSYCHMDEV